MYLPKAFAESDPEKLHQFIDRHSFGLLVTSTAGVPFASHLPFMLHRGVGPQGTLIGHVARANPQWEVADQQEVLAIFSGPHAYISPTSYDADLTVPTWNYTAVHVYGRMTVVEEPDKLRDIVDALVEVHEQPLPNPWRSSPEELAEKWMAEK